MASSSAGKFRPWTYILTFVGLVVLLYGLMLTPGSNSPKLGIDLQGGTRITLSAQTVDGSTPSRESMLQARTIMETRVNGSGVVGAQVQIDGARQLVVTVPGTEDLGDLARSARMNIRPVAAPAGTPLIFGAPQPADGAEGTDSSEATSSGPAPTTRAAIGETLSNPPSMQDSDTAAESSAAESSAAETSAGESSAPETSAAETSAAETTASGDGLRAGAALTTATESSATESSATESSAAESTDAAESSDAPASSESAAGTGTEASGSEATGSAALGTVDEDGKADEALLARFPEGSDPANPTQPAGTDEAAFTAWETAAQTTLGAGQLTCNDLSHWQGLDEPDKPLLACDEEGAAIYVLEETLIEGDQIESATAGLSSQGSGWAVNVKFGGDGFNTWYQYTAGHIGTQTAFTLDGQVLSAPSINSAINTAVTEVSGSFTQQTATDLANSLKFGALPLQFQLDKTDTVSSEVGSEALKMGLIAGGIGLLLVVLYCLAYYRLLGLITILSLVLSGALVYAVMVLLGRWMDLSLDMAGIAGLIIAIGITADSFVIYFERLKDEVREGRTFRSAVPRGWERAKHTILSADAVTFMSAVILYVLAVGDVKGFAFTLGLSTVLDLVVVFLVTHPLVSLAADAQVFKSPKWSGLGAVADAGARQRAAASRLTAKEA